MDQLLDLSISLNVPPPNSLLEVIATIDIRCDQLGLFHSGGMLTNPFKEKEAELLRWYLEEYWRWPYEQFLKRGRYVEDLLTDLGERLYHTLFGSPQARDIVQTWRLYDATLRQISIKSSVPAALSLPWELLHDEQGFLVLRTRPPVSLVRCLPLSQVATLPVPFEPPLRILVVTARPEGTGFVDPRSIARELVDEVQEQIEAGTITLEFLRPPTLSSLRTRLGDMRRPPVHVLHFDGHGTFESDLALQDELRLSGGGQGMLAFEKEGGELDLVKAEEIAQVLQHSGVRLAVLTACQSAMSSSDDAFSSVASRLIKGGVDAVVAMSASVLVASATLYAEAFYHALAMGIPASIAHERARQALYDNPRRHLTRRHRDEEGKPVELRDWWLPHFYQQRPLLLQATRRVRRRNRSQYTSPSSRLSEGMPTEPRYGFSGRARELLHIERWLIQGKVVVVHGFGGIGKTALVREAADWLTQTKMYEGACFVSFEHDGDATSLLNALGHYLGIYDSQYNPNDWTKTLKQLKPTLKKRRILVIADNLESILPNGEASLDAAMRTQLWNVLLELATLGAGVLLSSRNAGFGDGRLTPGKQVVHLSLNGLYSEDAYTLACRLLDDLRIDRKRVSYSRLRDLLSQLDYHPLAIQLVLPTLYERSVEVVYEELATLLPLFADEIETGRNRSLLASLEYSLRQLDEEHLTQLLRVVPFEKGATEAIFLAVTEISESTWVQMRPALERAALLTVEYMHENHYFLHFHPVLIPFLRNKLEITNTGDQRLYARYTIQYISFAKFLSALDAQKPQVARPWVRHELPNLRRAMELALAYDNGGDAITDMSGVLLFFLDAFGLLSEKKVLQQQVTDALRRVKAQQDNLLEVEADVTDGSRTVSPTTEDLNVKITTLAAGETVTVNAGTRLIIPGKNGSLSIPIPESMVENMEDEGPEDPKEGSDDSNEYRHFPLIALHREPWQDDEAFEATLSAIVEVISAMPKGMTLYFYVSPELDSITLTLGIYNGSLVSIEAQLRKALAGVELLERRISKSDTKKRFASIHVTLLAHLGDILYEQGDYLRAREVFEQCWQVSIEQENVRQQVLTGARIGAFERNQGEYLRAQSYLDAALKAAQVLGEPLAEAQIWQQLGLLEETQKKWSEAERCYREDLILQEQASSQEGIIASYSNLGKLQKEIGRFDEAEGWYKRALEMAEQTPHQIPFICNNFAAVLLEAVEAGHFPMARLAESRKYAEQALALYETATELAPKWTPLLILTRIASLMGDKEAERNLLRRSREAYIVPKENRDHVDWEFGWIIQAVAMAVTGSEQMQTILETNMPLFEKQRFILAKAIQHILAGEREWHILSEEMSGEDALITLRILETIRGENDKVIKFWLIDE